MNWAPIYTDDPRELRRIIIKQNERLQRLENAYVNVLEKLIELETEVIRLKRADGER